MDLLNEQKNLYEWFQMSADVKLSKKLLEVFNVAGIGKISMQLKKCIFVKCYKWPQI